MSRLIALLAIAVLSFVSNACEKVPLLAPSGSSIFLTLPEEGNTMGLNSSMQITAIVTESGGTPPHNGTLVTFTTTMGHLDPGEARTTGGRASTTFFTGTRSGTATIRAFSGAAGTGEGTASATINIGGAAEDMVLALRVEGNSNNGRNTVIVAYLSDGDGNAIPGFTVSFSTNRGQLTRGLEVTDANGEARTTLNTAETATVTARAAGVEAEIEIPVEGALDLEITAPTDRPAEVGEVVRFTLTPEADSVFTDVVINFGDGQEQTLGRVTAERNFQHVYDRRGTYTVTARGTTSTGAMATATAIIQVVDRGPLQLRLEAAPNPVATGGTQQGLVVLTATLTALSGQPASVIQSVEWSFGDNTPGARGTDLIINHRYATAGTYVATVRVRTTDGREATAATTVRVITQ